MPDERALGVELDAAGSGGVVGPVVEIRRRVGEPSWIRDREAAGRLLDPEDDVDEPVGLLLAREERRQHRRRRVGVLIGRPVERHGGPSVDDHDGVRIGGGDALDELVLTAGELHRRAVEALGLPLVVRPDDHDRRVRLRGRGDRPVEQVGGLRTAYAESEGGEAARPAARPVGGELDLLTGAQLDRERDLVVSVAEELLGAREPTFRIVEDDVFLPAGGDAEPRPVRWRRSRSRARRRRPR